MPLKDPHLCDALKVQVQIIGVSQVQDTYAATPLSTCGLQNHAFDMAVFEMAQTDDALLIQVDPGLTPMCTFVPRQLTRDKMISLFLKSWITKYMRCFTKQFSQSSLAIISLSKKKKKKWRSRDKILEGSTKKERCNNLSNPNGTI